MPATLPRMGTVVKSNTFLQAALSLIFAAVSGAAYAAYPDRPIRWIVPAAAGGAADITVRIVAADLAKRINQQIVIDNRPGASGTLGLDLVAKATPDGYTIGTANTTNYSVNRAVLTHLPYNIDRDFQPVAHLSTQPNMLGVTMSLPVKTVRDLIDYARKHPHKLLYASSGTGSSLHAAAELFKLMTDTKMDHVPFKSTPVANTELIAGRIQLMFDNLSSIGQYVKAGRVRGLGVTSLKRSAAHAEIPTIAEAGVPGYEVTVWGGVVSPAGVPRPVVTFLNAAMNRSIGDPAVRDQLNARGYDTTPISVEQFTAFINKENAKWADVVKRAGIKAD
jgi:tripartite-type tricarboxylate transporter receptor subunit TctC